MEYIRLESYIFEEIGRHLFAPWVPRSARGSGQFLFLNRSGVWQGLQPRVRISIREFLIWEGWVYWPDAVHQLQLV